MEGSSWLRGGDFRRKSLQNKPILVDIGAIGIMRGIFGKL
jgi:hypothetical protein